MSGAWEFAPLVSSVLSALTAAYLAGVAAVRHRHPARPAITTTAGGAASSTGRRSLRIIARPRRTRARPRLASAPSVSATSAADRAAASRNARSSACSSRSAAVLTGGSVT